MPRYMMAYDADCGACTRFKSAVAILDIHRETDFVPLSTADESGLLEGVPVNLRYRSFHLLLPGKQVLSGADALPELIRLFPAGRACAKMITGAPGGRKAMTFVYSAFSKLHDASSCRHRPTRALGSRGK